MKRKAFISLLLLSSCTTGINMKSVDYDHLFNDSNSKVWLVNKMMKDNAVISSSNTNDKHIMVFHQNGKCDYIALRDITRKDPLKGIYFLKSQTRELSIEFGENALWDFDLAYLKEDSILMVPTEKSTMEYSIQLKPFPEL